MRFGKARAGAAELSAGIIASSMGNPIATPMPFNAARLEIIILLIIDPPKVVGAHSQCGLCSSLTHCAAIGFGEMREGRWQRPGEPSRTAHVHPYRSYWDPM